jgi:hypothetical protein
MRNDMASYYDMQLEKTEKLGKMMMDKCNYGEKVISWRI